MTLDYPVYFGIKAHKDVILQMQAFLDGHGVPHVHSDDQIGCIEVSLQHLLGHFKDVMD